MSDYPMLISNKLHSFRNFNKQTYEKYLVQYGLGIYEGYVKSSETPTGYTPGYANDQLKYVNGTDWLKRSDSFGIHAAT